MRPVRFTISPAAADADGICASQTPAAGGVQSLTIEGALASGGAVTFDEPRHVSVTCAGDETARTFTFTGPNYYGDTMTETVAGVNAATASGTKNFAGITSVTVDDDTAGAVTVGTTSTLDSRVVRLGRHYDVIAYSLAITGTVTANAKYTIDRIEEQADEYSAFWTSTSGDKSGSYAGNIQHSVEALRISLSNITADCSVEISIMPTAL